MALTTQNTRQLTRKKVMSKSAKHYLPSGKLYSGATHKMGGELHTGATHTAKSQKLSHTPAKKPTNNKKGK